MNSAPVFGAGVHDDMTSTTGVVSAVGALCIDGCSDGCSFCSGTLVRRDRVVTAMHCLCASDPIQAANGEQKANIFFCLPQPGAVPVFWHPYRVEETFIIDTKPADFHGRMRQPLR